MRGGLLERLRDVPRVPALLAGGAMAAVLAVGGVAVAADGSVEVEVQSCARAAEGEDPACAAAEVWPRTGMPRVALRPYVLAPGRVVEVHPALTGGVTVLIAAASAGAHPATAAEPDPAASSIGGFLDRTIPDGASGTLVAVRGHDVVSCEGFGWADRAARVPAGCDTVYDIGSLTKQFTAAAVVKLADARQARRARSDRPMARTGARRTRRGSPCSSC